MGGRPIKILAVSAHYPPYHGGGYGLVCQWFCDGLVQRGHSVTALTSFPGSNAAAVENKPGTVQALRELRLIPPGTSPTGLLSATAANVAAVRRVVREVNPDVVFCCAMDGVGFNTYHAATTAGRPSLSWLGDTWLGQAWRNLRAYDPWADVANGGRRGGMGRFAKRAIGLVGRARGLFSGEKIQFFHPVAAISEFVLNDLKQSGAPVPETTPTIPVPLDPNFFTPQGQPIGHCGGRTEQLRALFVGRMERLKGPDVAVAGLAAAVANGSNVRLTFAGLHIEGMRPELEQQAKALGVQDRIVWAGTPPVKDLVELYRTHDVFLFPSRIVEGLGAVNCEAIACGLPVIGTAHSGSAEVIHDGETGFRVLKDDPAAVGRHLTTLHQDRELLTKLSESATRFATRYRRDKLLEMLEAELVRVVKN